MAKYRIKHYQDSRSHPYEIQRKGLFMWHDTELIFASLDVARKRIQSLRGVVPAKYIYD